MTVAFYTGSFDPPHNGHETIIGTASAVFDKLYIGVGHNPEKTSYLLPIEDRVELVKSLATETENVEVLAFEGLARVAAAELRVDCFVKGLRSSVDLADELLQAKMNQQWELGVPTVFLPTLGEWAFLSSRYVREVFRLGGDISQVVPDGVYEKLVKR